MYRGRIKPLTAAIQDGVLPIVVARVYHIPGSLASTITDLWFTMNRD